MTLLFQKKIKLPVYKTDSFDHADIHFQSNTLFVAHTATNSIEIIDCANEKHIGTISGCTEANGVLCAQNENLVFGASRGSGKILLINTKNYKTLGELSVGTSQMV